MSRFWISGISLILKVFIIFHISPHDHFGSRSKLHIDFSIPDRVKCIRFRDVIIIRQLAFRLLNLLLPGRFRLQVKVNNGAEKMYWILCNNLRNRVRFLSALMFPDIGMVLFNDF